MKHLFFLLAFFLLTNLTYSQNTIAKLKYEEAEEAYIQNNFSTALIRLDEAQKLLGAVNPKLLYLRIMAQKGLIAKGVFEYADLESARKNVAFYLKSYENNEGIEEKYRDVYKFSEELQQYPATLQIYNNIKEQQNKRVMAAQEKEAKKQQWLASLGGNFIYERNGEVLVAATKDLGFMSWANAKAACEDLVLNGYDDWYLPSELELRDIYYKGLREEMANFKKNEFYWFSTQDGAKGGIFPNGSVNYFSGLVRGHVRPVRKTVPLGAETLKKEESNADFDKGYYQDVTTKKYDKALYYYSKAAAAGYGLAMNNIGLLYESGKGVKQDINEALSWYRKAAEKGDSWGLFNLGRAYYHGLGVVKDANEALNYFLQSAAKNNEWGMNGAADTYHFLLKDYTKAFEWYSKAVAKDHIWAMHMIGYSYINGLGIDKDPAKAIEYFEKAAAKEERESFYQLGWIYKNGFSVPVNYSSAIQWLQRAADKGHQHAMGELAEMYEKGLGVKEDKAKAQELRDKQAGK